MNILIIIFAFFSLTYNQISYGNDNIISIIRDSETESVIKRLSSPLFKAANIDPDTIKVLIVNNQSINAYVIDNNNIFIHRGLLESFENPDVFLGVLAHELGHITANHTLHLENRINNMNLVSIIGVALGFFTTVALNPEIGTAISLGSGVLATKIFLKNSRLNEKVADQYALTYLDKAGYDTEGFIDFFQYMMSKLGNFTKEEEYLLTHPLSIERLTAAQRYKRNNPIIKISSTELANFKRITEKLTVSLASINTLTNKHNYNRFSDYSKSIILYRKNKVEDSLKMISSLIKNSPEDPYFYELRAQIFTKLGRTKESIKDYEKALKLSKEDILIKIQLSDALLNTEPKKSILYLEEVLSVENNNSFLWKQLSIAYGRTGEIGMSYFALAKKSFIEKNSKLFFTYFNLAKKSLANNSNLLIYLDDMMSHINDNYSSNTSQTSLQISLKNHNRK